ncbi:hypothetical protein [Deinococcus aquaedulcis]|uniref:hypothetical protein n=1 Tax=Deinococcus aquaedulcis TaxID=2840455 RepID=UPI001C832E57|nr:hypothetical protein [Deinococcus aquaedulcis]
MNTFLNTALSFPAALWSAVFAACVLGWLLVALGLLDSDGLDGALGGAAGLSARLGLSGVPALLVLTVLTFLGWVGTYMAQRLVLSSLPAGVQFGAGVVTLALSLPLAAALTAALLRPLRRLSAQSEPTAAADLVGRRATVASAAVDAASGRVMVEDGGAGLIFEARALPPDRPVRGQRVVLLAYDPETHRYQVASETPSPKEF